MLKRISIFAVFAVLVFHPLAFAHGGGTHIMGTVTTLDAQHVVIKTKTEKTMSVLLTDNTTYRNGTAAATSTDLKVGDRVVVHATGKGNNRTASEIQFSSGDTAQGHEGMHHGSTKP